MYIIICIQSCIEKMTREFDLNRHLSYVLYSSKNESFASIELQYM